MLTIDLFDGVLLVHDGDLTWDEEIVAHGSAEARISGDLIIGPNANIVGNGVGEADHLTLKVGGTVSFEGVAGGSGLTNLTIIADDSIEGSDDVGAITINDGVAIDIDGDLRLLASKAFDLTWDAVTPVFNSRVSNTSIDVGNAHLTASNILIESSAVASKHIDLDVDTGAFEGFTFDDAFATLSGTPVITFIDKADQDGIGSVIRRSSGSWLTDGFSNGDLIRVAGSVKNNGQYRLGTVGNTELTLVPTDQVFDETLNFATTTANASIAEVKEIETEDVTLEAFDELGNKIPGSSVIFDDFDDGIVESFATVPLLDTLTDVGVQVVRSSASSGVTIMSGAVLIASGDVTLRSTALSDVSISIPSLIVGVTVGESDATAETTLETGSRIDAGGDVVIDSNSTNNLQSQVKIYSGSVLPIPGASALNKIKLPGPAINIAIGDGTTQSESIVDQGASVFGRDVSVTSRNTNNFDVSTISRIFFPESNLGQAIGVSLSDAVSTSTAQVVGNVTASGNVRITSDSVNETNDLEAYALVANESPRPLGIEYIGAIENKLKAFDLDQNADPGALGISAGVGIAETKNTANAFAGAGSTIASMGDLTVQAYAEDNFESHVEGGARAGTAYSIGGAVSITDFANHANATIAAGATTDALGETLVKADAIIPFQLDLLDLGDAFRSFGATPFPEFNEDGDVLGFFDSVGDYAEEGILRSVNVLMDAFVPFINSRLGVDDLIATTFVAASAKAGSSKQDREGKFAISGTVNLLDVTNEATAKIGEGARVNTNPDFATSLSVEVSADSTIETINISGLPGVGSLFTQSATKSQGSAVGGTYSDIEFANRAKANIDDNAIVNAKGSGADGDVRVRANTNNFTVNVTDTGGDAKKFGVTGTWNRNDFINDAQAWIEDTAVVDAGNDVILDADNIVLGVLVTGSIVLAGRAGVGATVAIEDSNTTVKAFIGDANGNLSQPNGTVTAGGNVEITADNIERLFTISIAGSVAGGSAADGDALDGISLPNLFDGTPNDRGKTGIGIAGDVALNTHSTTTEAFIAGSTVNAMGDVMLSAETFALELVVAGAFAIDKSSVQGGIAIAGSLAWNDLARTTRAFIQDANVTAANVGIDAFTEDVLISVAIGGGGSTRSGTAGVIGSVNLNEVDNTTSAGIWGDSQVVSAGLLTSDAKDELDAVTVAGSLAISGTIAAAASGDIGLYDREVTASLGGASTARANGGTARFKAEADESIVSAALSIGAATKTLGVGAAVASQHLDTRVEAHVDPGGSLFSTGDVDIVADNDTQIIGVGASVAFGNTAGLGAGLGNSNIDRTVIATIDDGAEVTALDRMTVSADAADDLYLFGVGAGVGGTGGLAASAVLNRMTSTVDANIGDTARINQMLGVALDSQSVRVLADHETSVLSVAGGFAGGKTFGLGGAGDIELIDKNVLASIGTDALVEAQQDVEVRATADDSFISIGASVGGGGTFSLQASAVVITLDNRTEAWIDRGAQVYADGNVKVAADSEAEFVTVAGNLGYGGTAGVGASNSTIVKTDTTQAWIADEAVVTGRGLGQSIFVPSDNVSSNTGRRISENLFGVSVTATSTEDFLTIAGAGTAAGTAGIAGSAVVNLIHGTTMAWIGKNTRINVDRNPFSGVNQRVNVLADDFTEILSVAGAIGGAGTVGAGAGADVGTIEKRTEAFVDASADVRANEHLFVRAYNDEDIFSVSGSIGAAGTVGIAGTAGVYTLNNSTNALVKDSEVGKRTQIDVQGSVIVDSANQSEMDIIAGNISGAGTVNIGASGGVAIIDKSTMARIGANADVTAAQVNRGTLMAPSGTITNGRISQAEATEFTFPEPDGQGNIVDRVRSLNTEVGSPGAASADLDDDGTPEFSNEPLTTQRTVMVGTKQFSGVSVTATNLDDIDSITANGGGSGTVALNASGAVTITDMLTEASIGTGAVLDSGAAIQIHGLADIQHMGVAAALSFSGVGAVTAGADVSKLKSIVQSIVSDHASLVAATDVFVTATNTSYVLTVSAGGGLALKFGLGGAVSLVAIDNTTTAYLGDADASEDAGAHVDAGGNVVVLATDNSETFNVTGALGAGIAIAGIGGSVSDLTIEKDTQAYIGPHSVVDALGNTSDVGIIDDVTPEGQLPSATARGVIVMANSVEKIDNYAAAAAGGLMAGIGGGVTIQFLDSNTTAYVGRAAEINHDPHGTVNDAQDVQVQALNGLIVATVGGGVAAGAVGLAGGVDIGTVRNDTTAFIDSEARAAAARDVSVKALSPKHIQTVAISGAAALAAATGSVTVWTIGTDYDASYEFTETEFDFISTGNTSETDVGRSENAIPDSEYNSARDEIEDQSLAFGRMLGDPGGYSNADSNPESIAPDANQEIGNAMRTAGNRITSAGRSSAARMTRGTVNTETGTIAFIGEDAEVTAGADVEVLAKDVLLYDAIAGSAGLAGVSIGGAVIIANVELRTQATVSPRAVINAGQDVTIEARLDETVDGFALAGSLGGVLALGAQVMLFNDTSTQLAQVLQMAEIGSADDVNVLATAERDIPVDISGGGASLLAAAGASVGLIDVRGNATAEANGVAIGHNDGVGDLNVNAHANTEVEIDGVVIGGSLGIAFSGGLVDVQVHNDVSASAEQTTFVDTRGIDVSGDVDVSTTNNNDVNIDMLQVGAGLVAGVGGVLADVVIGGTSKSKIGDAVSARDVSITSSADNQIATEATTGAGGLLAGAGNRITGHAITELAAELGTNADLLASGAITVDTRSLADVDLDVKGITVGALAAGVVIARATVQPSVRTIISPTAKVVANDEITVRALHNFTESGAKTDNQAHAKAVSSGGSLLGGNGALPTARSQPIVGVDVGAASFRTLGDLYVDARSHDVAIADAAPSITIGILAGLGATKAVATAGGSVFAKMNGEVETGDARNVYIRSLSSVIADAESTASGGGLVGFNGAIAHATAIPVVETEVGSDILSPSNDILIRAGAETGADAYSTGATGGLVGVGNTRATAQDLSSVTVKQTDGDLSAGGNINITSAHNFREDVEDPLHFAIKATADPTSGGAGAFVVAIPVAKSDATVTTDLRGDLEANHNISINALSMNRAEVAADGAAYGGIGVANVDGAAFAMGTTEVNFSGNIQSAGETAGADNVSIISDGRSVANADTEASSGGAFGGTGTDAWSITLPKVFLDVENANVRARCDVEILSKLDTSTNSQGTGTDRGGVTVGNTDSHAWTATKNDLRSYDSQIISAGDVTIESQTTRSLLSTAVGSGKAGAAVSNATAWAAVLPAIPDDLESDDLPSLNLPGGLNLPNDRDSSTTTLIEDGQIEARDELRIQALANDTILSGSGTEAKGLGAGADARSSNISQAATTTTIRSGADVSGDSVVINASPTAGELRGNNARGLINAGGSYAFAGGAGTNADATTVANLRLAADVNLHDATILGSESVVIWAVFDGVDSEARADSDSRTGFGDTDALRFQELIFISDIDVDDGVKITTGEIDVRSELVDADVKSTGKIDGGLLDFGDSISFENVVASRTVDFNADLTILGEASLHVDENGAITHDNGIGASVGSIVSVPDITNATQGRIRIAAPRNQFDAVQESVGAAVVSRVSGRPVIRNGNVAVDITNLSDKTLFVRDINPGGASGGSNIEVEAIDKSGFRPITGTVDRTGSRTDIFSVGDIHLSGDMAAERIDIETKGEITVQFNANEFVTASLLNVTAAGGSIASAGRPLKVRTAPSDTFPIPEIAIDAHASIDVQLRNISPAQPTASLVDVKRIHAKTGDVQVLLQEGTNASTAWQLDSIVAEMGDITMETVDHPAVPTNVLVAGDVRSPEGTTTITLHTGTTRENNLTRSSILSQTADHLITAKDVSLNAPYGWVGNTNTRWDNIPDERPDFWVPGRRQNIRVQLTGGALNATSYRFMDIVGVGPLNVGTVFSESRVSLYTEDTTARGEDIILGPAARVEGWNIGFFSGDTVQVHPDAFIRSRSLTNDGEINEPRSVNFFLDWEDADPGVPVEFTLDRSFQMARSIGVSPWGDDDDLVMIEHAIPSQPVGVGLRGGNDTVRIGAEAGTLDAIQGDVVVVNFALDQFLEPVIRHEVEIHDNGNTSPASYQFTDRTLTRPGVGTITYHRNQSEFENTVPVSSVTLLAGSAENQVDFSITEPDEDDAIPHDISFHVVLQDANDEVGIAGLLPESTLIINGDGGRDTFTLSGDTLAGSVLIDGHSPTTARGDELFLDAGEFTQSATSPGGGTLAATGSGTVEYVNIEDIYGLFAFDVEDIRIRGSDWADGTEPVSILGMIDAPLPWTSLDRIEVQFNQTPVFTQDSAELTGFINPDYIATSVEQNGHTVTWTFDRLPTDLFEFVVSGEADDSSPVHNFRGEFPAGGDVTSSFAIVRGDSNQDGKTTIADIVATNQKVGETSAPNPFDLNGSGEVTVTDILLAAFAVGESLPSGDPPEPLHAETLGPGAAPNLSNEQLRDVYDAAVEIYVRAGLSEAEADVLRHQVSVSVGALEGNQLGTSHGLSIRIDDNAAGWGWYLDRTPFDDCEFQDTGVAGALEARTMFRQDLLTAVLHEIGHLLGLDHHDHLPRDVMSESLPAGERRLPQDMIFAEFHNDQDDHDDHNHQVAERRCYEHHRRRQARWRFF